MKNYIRPKYKIGDVVTYLDRYDDKDYSMEKVIQSEIIEAYSLLEKDDPKDKHSWYYITREIDTDKADSLLEKDIIEKL